MRAGCGRSGGQRTSREARPPAPLCRGSSGSCPPASFAGEGRGAPQTMEMLRRRPRFRTRNSKSSCFYSTTEAYLTSKPCPPFFPEKGTEGCGDSSRVCTHTHTHVRTCRHTHTYTCTNTRVRARAHTHRRSNTDIIKRPPAKYQCFTVCTWRPPPGEGAASQLLHQLLHVPRTAAACTLHGCCTAARAPHGCCTRPHGCRTARAG